jgi:hypothetical protein
MPIKFKMVPVPNSSNIHAVGYDPATMIMRVQFKNGSTYTHADVPPERHAEFMQAASKGSHYHNNFRSKYNVKKEERA